MLVDGSVEVQQYIEDCQVCCRPIDILISVSEDGSCQVDARDENSLVNVLQIINAAVNGIDEVIRLSDEAGLGKKVVRLKPVIVIIG